MSNLDDGSIDSDSNLEEQQQRQQDDDDDETPAGNNTNNSNTNTNTNNEQLQQEQDQVPPTPNSVPGTPVPRRTTGPTGQRSMSALNFSDSDSSGGGTGTGSGSGSRSHDDEEGGDTVAVPSTPQVRNTNRNMSIPSTPASVNTSASTSASRSINRKRQRRVMLQNDNEEEEEEVVPPTPAAVIDKEMHASRNGDDDDDDDDDEGDGDGDNTRDGYDENASVRSFMSGYGSYGTTSMRSLTSRTSRGSRGTSSNSRASRQIRELDAELEDDTEEMERTEEEIERERQAQGERALTRLDMEMNNDNRFGGGGDDSDGGDGDGGEQSQTLIRGTDINIRLAQLAFKDFLQNFISPEKSERVIKKAEREERNRKRREKRLKRQAARRGSGGGDDDGDGDDDAGDGDDDSWADSHSSIDSFDSEDDVDDDDDDHNNDRRNQPFYMEKLREILLGRYRQRNDHGVDENDAMTSSIAIATTASIDLNALHLYYHSPQCQRLYHQLVSYPAEVIPLMDLIVGREMEALLHELHYEMEQLVEEDEDSRRLDEYAHLQSKDAPLPRIQVRPFNMKSLSFMRALDPQTMDNLLSIRGMVVRTSPIIPDLKVAHFECSICSLGLTVTLERGRITEPSLCERCNVKNGFEIIHNRCLFADKQMVRIQETPNEVPPGETPASIVLFAYDDLVDAVRPGDRIEVTGVFRAQGRRVNPKISKLKSVYRTYVDVIHFRKVSGEKENTADAETTGDNEDEKNEEEPEGKSISVENIGGQLSQRRIEQLETLARSPDIYEKLVQSLAPSIWELDDVKKGVLCMLFGGNSKRIKKGTAEKKKRLEDARGRGIEDEEMASDDEEHAEDDATKLNKRGDINILLCGDPGTSKSQLLSYVHKLSPRGVYTSGKGSSAVGLTASVVRDPETRDLVLESGALVLSDLGICCIDEFDKMSDTTRAILHEAMEQQTVSIAKAGIIATLNARTAILASANPVESRYNPQLSVVDNIKLPPTLLSRFDLIYLILDAPNVESDRRLAQHLVGLYYETPNVVQPPLDHTLLRDYISYARDFINPELSDLATRELLSAYLEMRKMGSNSGNNNGSRTISATPRQLESLIRLSEATAKMRYSRVVERSDVKEAVRLMRVATQAAATDPRTGRIDMDMITTGRSTANREMEEALNLSLKELLAERRGNRMAVSDVRSQLSEIMNVSTLRQEDVVEGLRVLEGDGIIQFNERAQTIFVRAGVQQ